MVRLWVILLTELSDECASQIKKKKKRLCLEVLKDFHERSVSDNLVLDTEFFVIILKHLMSESVEKYG